MTVFSFRWLKRILLFFAIVFGIASCEEISEKYRYKFDKIDVLIGLKKALTYMSENVKELDDDAILGVVIAYGQLKLLNEKYGGEQSAKLKSLESVAENIFETYKKDVAPLRADDVYHKIFREEILDYELWMKVGLNINKSMSCKRNFIFSKDSSEQDPYVELSDKCLTELLVQKNNINECKMSEYCHNAIIKGPAWGYGLSHRLLYFMIAKGMDCQFQVPFEEFCCRHAEEMDVIKKYNYPGILKDLFIEEAVLCTMSGFRYFVDDEFVSLSLEWQRSEGCWEIVIPENIKKRSNKSFGKAWCSTHFSGLNVAYLAVAARHYYQ